MFFMRSSVTEHGVVASSGMHGEKITAISEYSVKPKDYLIPDGGTVKLRQRLRKITVVRC
jgi:hypothetical protein